MSEITLNDSEYDDFVDGMKKFCMDKKRGDPVDFEGFEVEHCNVDDNGDFRVQVGKSSSGLVELEGRNYNKTLTIDTRGVGRRVRDVLKRVFNIETKYEESLCIKNIKTKQLYCPAKKLDL